ncbi:fatty acid desaturase [Oleiphilus messinensis]|uniref:Fatty acid desaturase n=1 Tax=Oleiphilus messinensis TaxID=141451 RepID=A0A1Y0IE24_9GAMM|nr:fatty acid desaturase [Oleiphilus messinensis]ARU58419.1 fatty acid desaturase [Oleiphilus messinensis]
MEKATDPLTLSMTEREALIRSTIKDRGEQIRKDHPLLANNDLCGMSIFLFAISGVLVSGWAYWQSLIPAWICIPLVAMFTSLLHELEHDLIHWMYFKKNKAIHNLMMLGVWVFRPGTINPWVRRQLHFLHHKTSGTEQDLEERGIGNGHPYGVLRFWIMSDTLVGNLFRILFTFPPERKAHALKGLFLKNFPLAIATGILWYGFLLFHAVNFLLPALGATVVWSESTLNIMSGVSFLIVTLIAPFYLRSFCLNFISSNMHYYGNVNSVIEQTQVLNSPLFWPMQLFCFNFGSTHGIHHFVVGETFYIRQLTAPAAHKVMREHGVRFNDFGTFRRNNRFQPETPSRLSPAVSA